MEQVLLRDLGSEEKGLFPKLYIDQATGKLVVKTKIYDANGKWTGKYKNFKTSLTTSVNS